MPPEIEELTAKIDGDPVDAWLYDERGWAWFIAGQKALAIQDFDRAIALDENEPAFRLGRGFVYECMGYIDIPRDDFNRAIELDPGYAMAYAFRGSYRSSNTSTKARWPTSIRRYSWSRAMRTIAANAD